MSQQKRTKTLVTSAADAQVYDIVCGYGTTVNELWKALLELSGTNMDPQYLSVRHGDIVHSLADISNAKGGFYFLPDTSFQIGLKKHTNGL